MLRSFAFSCRSRKYGNLGRVKTTIEIPDDLFKKAKATAALRGESLREFVNTALETRLASARPPMDPRTGWRSVFGLAQPKTVERIDRFISAEMEQIDPSEWR